MLDNYKMAQGPAKPVEPDSEEERKDLVDGITKPNLHRRIDNESTPLSPEEVKPDTYELSVGGVSSYRTTTHTIHDEESTTTEIP
jgi:hypothetical protein